MACDRAALAPYDVGVPRYTRQQVLRRRRIAALILAALVLIVFVSCTAGLVRLVSHGGEAEATAAAEPTVDTGTDALTIPRTATDASALSQLPSGESLRDGEVLGIDVSAHQGDIDWTTVRSAGVSFAYIKATEGVGHTDDTFASNWTSSRTAGVARGAYHYFTLCSSGADQAKAFLAAVPPDEGSLPPAVDLELDGSCTQEPDSSAVKEEVDAFVTAVEKAWGRRVVVYSSWEWRNRYTLPEETERPQWHTRDSRRPETDWDIWQVRFDARVDGIDSKVDLDVMDVAGLQDAASIDA